MKEYRIAYTYNAENGTRDYINIVERSEAAARKDFKAHHKDGTILDVELIAEDVPATKQQERDALETIRKIIGELGPSSYVGTAFEGCLQDAENNIEDDAAYSMKERLESAEDDIKELRGKLSDAEGRLKELGRLVDSLKDERRSLECKLAGQTLPEWLRYELYAFAAEESAAAWKRVEESAEIMAKLVDTPRDIAFVSAVESFRKAKERRDRCERLLSGLNEIQPED